ncbi:MAG: hypothetical protein WAU01_06870 [Saprospiraceae bacterium]
MNSKQRSRIHFLEKSLRKLINSWQLMPGCPNDEFDDLNNKILSCLVNQKNQNRVKGIIETYVKVDVGLSMHEEEIETKFQEVMAWWSKINKEAEQ